MKRDVSRIRKWDVTQEESPVKDSRSNGIIGQIRALKGGLEARLGSKVESDHPGLPWLVMHSASTMNRYLRSPDGETAHRRIKGQTFDVPVVELERCGT